MGDHSLDAPVLDRDHAEGMYPTSPLELNPLLGFKGWDTRDGGASRFVAFHPSQKDAKDSRFPTFLPRHGCVCGFLARKAA